MITRFIAAALAFTMAFGVSLESDKEKRMIAEAEYDYDYKGNGRVIAVIDSGFSLSHESFILTTDGRLTKDDIGNAALSVYSEYDEKGEKVEKAAKPDCYISEKIPFAYNNADDSTDLSGFETH